MFAVIPRYDYLCEDKAHAEVAQGNADGAGCVRFLSEKMTKGL